MKEKNNFGKAIKKIRKQNNLTMAELADKLGISRQGVYYWESGRNIPSNAMIDKITEMFSVDHNFLFGSSYTNYSTNKTENIIKEDTLRYGYNNFKTESNSFVQICNFESMTPLIIPGDTMIIETHNKISDNDIVLIQNNNELPSAYKVNINSFGMTLFPLNSNFNTFFISNDELNNNDLTISGVIVEIRRNLKNPKGDINE